MCYLDGRGVCVVVVGSAGVHCLCETQVRWERGQCPLTVSSVEHLDEEE